MPELHKGKLLWRSVVDRLAGVEKLWFWVAQRFQHCASSNGTNWDGTERGRSEPVHIASEGEELVRGSQAEPFVCAQATEGSKVESIESMSPFC
jgi:hypothetical protein